MGHIHCHTSISLSTLYPAKPSLDRISLLLKRWHALILYISILRHHFQWSRFLSTALCSVPRSKVFNITAMWHLHRRNSRLIAFLRRSRIPPPISTNRTATPIRMQSVGLRNIHIQIKSMGWEKSWRLSSIQRGKNYFHTWVDWEKSQREFLTPGKNL